MHCVVLLGAPGSGKGTQAAMISRDLQIPHISTGDILRGNPDPQIQALLSSGQLVSDEQMIAMVKERLSKEKNGWILDGFPRTIAQAESLKTFPIKVLYLQIDDSAVEKRLTLRRTCSTCGAIYHLANKPPKVDTICDLCGGPLIQRSDDRPEVVSSRLKTYHAKTAPLIAFFSSQGSLIEIPSSGTPEITHTLIMRALAS